MLRLGSFCCVAVGLALLAAQPAFAQSGGLGEKIDAAEKKLDEDIKACRPIDPKEYQQLSIDANRNAKAAVDAMHSGVPIDTTQLASDINRATALFERARAAAEKPCPPPKQAPQNPGTPPKKTETPPPPTTPQTGNGLGGTELDPLTALAWEAWDAIDELDEAFWFCDIDKIKQLIPELEELDKRAHQVADTARAAGKFSKIDPADADKLAKELDEALADAKKAKPCPVPPKSKPQTPPITPENKKGVSYELDPFSSRLLDVQNLERVSLGAQALRWNPRLALDARDWARELARIGEELHAPREGRGIERENLSKGLIGWNADQMTRSWFDERRDFVAGIYPNVARDGNWVNVSHYSQMIWPTTTDLGCGMAIGSGFQWLVCRYSPGGNKPGKPVGYGFDARNVGFDQGGFRVEVERPTRPPPTVYQWIDVKTGKPVKTIPVGIINGFDQATAVESGQASNPRTGQNFVRKPDGSWIDAKTGNTVKTVPVGVINGFDQATAVDSGQASNPRTGQNFARVPAQPARQVGRPERG